jgi:hypothetical protein
MTLKNLGWIVIANGLVQLAGLLLLGVFLVRGHREVVRMTRAVAGLVYQESERTRARIDEVLRHPSR